MKIILMLVLSFNLFSMTNSEKKENLRSVSVILEIDKDSEKYKSVLEGIESFPKINWQGFNRKAEVEYNEYVKSLLPYLLMKVKNEEIFTQEKVFSRLLKATQKMEKFVEMDQSDKVIHNFVREKLRLDKELKTCANIKAQFKGQEAMMRSQLDRIDLLDKDFLVKELSDISGRIHYISSEFSQ